MWSSMRTPVCTSFSTIFSFFILYFRTSGHGLCNGAPKQSSTAAYNLHGNGWFFLNVSGACEMEFLLIIFHLASKRKPHFPHATCQIPLYIVKVRRHCLDSLRSFVCFGRKECNERSTRWADKMWAKETSKCLRETTTTTTKTHSAD